MTNEEAKNFLRNKLKEKRYMIIIYWSFYDPYVYPYWNVLKGWVQNLSDATLYSYDDVSDYSYHLPSGGIWMNINDVIMKNILTL